MIKGRESLIRAAIEFGKNHFSIVQFSHVKIRIFTFLVLCTHFCTILTCNLLRHQSNPNPKPVPEVIGTMVQLDETHRRV